MFRGGGGLRGLYKHALGLRMGGKGCLHIGNRYRLPPFHLDLDRLNTMFGRNLTPTLAKLAAIDEDDGITR